MLLGGIYALERISQESTRDYWTVMENLTAFVRERTERTEAERTAKPLDQRLAERAYVLWEKAGRPEGQSEEFWAAAVDQEKYGDPPGADVAAVLTVIKRRSKDHHELEGTFDLERAVLRQAELPKAHLEHAYLLEAHLEGAHLREAHLEGADLSGADGVTQDQIDRAFGDAGTRLPAGLSRPAHWTKPDAPEYGAAHAA